MLKLRHFTQRLDGGARSCAARPARRADPRPRAVRSLLPSADGRIAHVFLVATHRLPGFGEGMLERLLRLAGTCPRVSLAVHQADAAEIRSRIAALNLRARVNLIVMPQDATLWPWAQDRVLVVRNSDGSKDVLDSGNGCDTGLAAAGAIGIAGSISLGMPLPGGNVLVHDDLCFVGADVSTDALAMVEADRPIEVIGCAPLERRGPTRFQTGEGDWSWRQDIDRSIAADGSRQPVFHIDMFLTLAGTAPDGTPRVLLGDPAWGSELSGVPLPDGFPLEAFAEIDRSLRRRGFNVLRNPLPFIYYDNREAKLREWFYASANNCWVECDATGGGRVFLPEYGFGAWGALKAADEANATIWEGLGFEVIRGGDFLPLADQLGSLNCVTRILERA
jgi:hypothetical protein